MIVVVAGILVLRLHAFVALILGALIVGYLTPTDSLRKYAHEKNMTTLEANDFVQQSVGERVANEFGRTCAKIGILIAMASIIGICLLASGAAERIIRSALTLLGQRHASLAFLNSAFLLGIPVYFDTVFYLMIPLAKATAVRTGKNYALYVLAIVAGGTMAHSLVPPTPGPLFVASELSVSIGMMILGGLVIGSISVSCGYIYALWANKKWPIPLRDTADISIKELKEYSDQEEKNLPPLWLSLFPIVLPVLLIAGKTIFMTLFNVSPSIDSSSLNKGLIIFFKNFGNPNIALTLSAGIALFTLVRQKRANHHDLGATVQKALLSGGLIILITAAGGAFGGILQQTGIGFRIQELASTYQLALLPLAFGVTALVRTAQGSATVAMITAVGILAVFSTQGQLDYHPVYLALAVACGSKPISWMNDSGFWVIGKMSGMTEAETLKMSSVLMIVMGVSGLLAIMILAKIIPLV
jgi:GntP family gluconate:H+ symporter